jgi:hypothetical protein
MGGTHPRNVEQQGYEADHSLPSSTEVKKGGATPPLPHGAILTFSLHILQSNQMPNIFSHASYCAARRLASHSLHSSKTNVVALDREPITPAERPPLVGRVSANFCGEGCSVVSATDPHGGNLGFSRPEPLILLPSSSSIVLTRLSGPRSRPTAPEKMW